MRLPESHRPQQQDAVPAADHHAVRHLHCSGSAPDCYGKAIQTAASTTIPAGETTWGAVFIANGLQLIIAILLIVLGITIVVNSFKSYAKSEKNSEKASA